MPVVRQEVRVSRAEEVHGQPEDHAGQHDESRVAADEAWMKKK